MHYISLTVLFNAYKSYVNIHFDCNDFNNGIFLLFQVFPGSIIYNMYNIYIFTVSG